MPEESQDDKKRQPSENNKTIGPNIEKQKKQQKYQQASSDYIQETLENMTKDPVKRNCHILRRLMNIQFTKISETIKSITVTGKNMPEVVKQVIISQMT